MVEPRDTANLVHFIEKDNAYGGVEGKSGSEMWSGRIVGERWGGWRGRCRVGLKERVGANGGVDGEEDVGGLENGQWLERS